MCQKRSRVQKLFKTRQIVNQNKHKGYQLLLKLILSFVRDLQPYTYSSRLATGMQPDTAVQLPVSDLQGLAS